MHKDKHDPKKHGEKPEQPQKPVHEPPGKKVQTNDDTLGDDGDNDSDDGGTGADTPGQGPGNP